MLFLEGSKLLVTGDDSCQIGSNHLEFSKVLGHRALVGYVVNSMTKTLVLGVAIVFSVYAILLLTRDAPCALFRASLAQLIGCFRP